MLKNPSGKSVAIAVFLALGLLAGSSFAEPVRMFEDAPTAEEMGRILFDTPAQNGQDGHDMDAMGKTRSISFSKKKPSHQMQEDVAEKSVATGSAVSAGENDAVTVSMTDTGTRAIGLPIKFATNSSELLPESLPFLNEVGKMLSMSKHQKQKLIIEGHTDASGSEEYNLLLSYRRAKAVRNYLVENFNIAESRLKVNGKGESSPLEGTDPMDGINRRVQFYKAQ